MYEELITRLYDAVSGYDQGTGSDWEMRCACKEAAAALEAMNNILEQARGERDVVTKRMIELERGAGKLTKERDAAVADLAAVFGKIECVRQAYGIDNADADNALADLCGEYCAACGKMCYKEGLAFRCDSFLWRGVPEGERST